MVFETLKERGVVREGGDREVEEAELPYAGVGVDLPGFLTLLRALAG